MKKLKFSFKEMETELCTKNSQAIFQQLTLALY